MSAPVIVFSPRSKLRLIVMMGLLAPIWWTWSAGRLTYAIFVASGSPSRPSLGLLWASVYIPAIVMGFVAGLVAALLSKDAPLKGWVIFCISLLVGAAIQSVLIGVALSDSLASYFGSYGNWLFWAASLLWPVWATLRGRRARARSV